MLKMNQLLLHTHMVPPAKCLQHVYLSAYMLFLLPVYHHAVCLHAHLFTTCSHYVETFATVLQHLFTSQFIHFTVDNDLSASELQSLVYILICFCFILAAALLYVL